jgi:hypothetical protein
MISDITAVQQHRLPCGLSRRLRTLQIRLGQELALNQTAMLGVVDQRDQEWQVGIGLHIVGEERHLPIDEEFLQDHMTHRHGQRGVCAGLCWQPFIGELGVVGVVRADGDDLGASIPHLGHPVRIGGPRDRDPDRAIGA